LPEHYKRERVGIRHREKKIELPPQRAVGRESRPAQDGPSRFRLSAPDLSRAVDPIGARTVKSRVIFFVGRSERTNVRLGDSTMAKRGEWSSDLVDAMVLVRLPNSSNLTRYEKHLNSGTHRRCKSNKKPKGVGSKRIVLGVDVHLRGYQAGRKVDNGPIGAVANFRSEAELLLYVEKQKQLAEEVAVVYEAGPLGYGLFRKLKAAGVRCYVCSAESTQQQKSRRGDGRPDHFIIGFVLTKTTSRSDPTWTKTLSEQGSSNGLRIGLTEESCFSVFIGGPETCGPRTERLGQHTALGEATSTGRLKSGADSPSAPSLRLV
jgi:hypothetical protein